MAKLKDVSGLKVGKVKSTRNEAVGDDPLMQPTRGRAGGLRVGAVRSGVLKPVARKRKR